MTDLNDDVLIWVRGDFKDTLNAKSESPINYHHVQFFGFGWVVTSTTVGCGKY